MDQRTLRYFLALAEERHFGRAATRVHIAQPALSQQIKQLESQLGVQLFDRSTRRVDVTSAGERFTEHARRIVAACERAADDMAAFAAGRVGQVSVGFVGTATYDVLPRLTRMVRTELPGIDLRVRGELLSPQLLDGLGTGEYDLALVRPPPFAVHATRPESRRLAAPPPGESHIVLETLRTEALLAVLAANHPIARHDPVDLAAMRDETFVTHPAGARSTMHHLVLDACARAGFRPPVVEVSETATLVVSVAAGLGVALAPAPVRSLGLDGVVYRRLRQRETVDLVLAGRTSESSPGVAAVAALVRAAASVHPTP